MINVSFCVRFPAISPLCLKNRQMGRDGAIGGCQILLLIATKLPHPLDMGKLVYFKIESRLIVLHFMSKVTCSVCNEGWISLRHGMDGYSGEAATSPLLTTIRLQSQKQTYKLLFILKSLFLDKIVSYNIFQLT